MYFIGQRQIMNQLKDILPYLFETGDGISILLRGPSGWGKTRMAFMICNYLTGGKFAYYLGDKFNFNPAMKVHFIDEVHLLPNAEELYPLIDAGKYVIVLATNDVVTLPEALVNRCVEFIFDKYTQQELRDICKTLFKNSISEPLLDYLIECGGGNPRIIKNLIGRLNIILVRRPDVLNGISIEDFKNLMENTFGMRDGMDVLCSRYMEALSSLGGRASLQTISTYIHVDQNTLRYYVEPILLYKNKIKITSKGRCISI